MPNTSKIIKDIEKLMGRLEKAMNPMTMMTVELFNLSGTRDAPPGDTVKFGRVELTFADAKAVREFTLQAAG